LLPWALEKYNSRAPEDRFGRFAKTIFRITLEHWGLKGDWIV
jgi:hypothetical protein